MEQEELFHSTATALGMTVPDRDRLTKQQITDRISDLLQSDFTGLVNLLYRLDIDEERLRSMLARHPGTDAADIITGLLLERQLQRLQSRRQYSRNDQDIDENEKW
ncbi:MAG: hypothetical protein ABW019_16085 [Chitinophagaceae bacterium]